MACSDPASAKRKFIEVDIPPMRKPRIVLATCGCVAAVKFGLLCHAFIDWADVRGVVTKSSLRFIDEVSIPKDMIIYCDEHEWRSWRRLGDNLLHIELCKWADILVIAPLSANTLGKIAGGLCDNLLTCIVRAWDYSKPFFVAPSMNTLMWKNPFTERQCMCIDELGISLIPPVSRKSGSGEYDTGAMPEPSDIYSTVKAFYDIKILKKKPGQV
ncbi:Flavoprotein [Sesbania bispinosa]|nr:Flavoprotein [Sesbania bispinosa]